MTTGPRPTSKRQSPKAQVVTTSGEIFADGTVIDLAASPDIRRPDLLFWDGKRATVAPRIQHGGIVYEAPELHPSIGQAIRFPAGTRRCSSATELFAEVAALLERYLGVQDVMAHELSLWNGSTWLSDVLPSPPPLVISGPAMAPAMTLFKLFSCVSRRALRLAGISRAALAALPMHLRPTLLINQPDLARGMSHLLRASNHRGLCVPAKGGAIQDWVGSKAVFLGMESNPNPWSGVALWVSLPPAQPGLDVLDEQTMTQIALHFLPRFMGFRLDWLGRKPETCYPGGRLPFAESELAHNLLACVQHEPGLIQTVTPLLYSQEQEATQRRMRDPSIAVLEVLWNPAHQARELPVKKITEYLNLRLRTRGEEYEYSEADVGRMLSHYGFRRDRIASGMVLRFSSEHKQLLHQLVRKFGLDLPRVQGCSHCAEPEANVPAVVQDV
jgi:hypothetical protein